MPNTDDPSNVDRIEADLERDRASIADTLDALRGKLTADALMTDAKSALVENIGPLTSRLDRTVRDNPLAVALIGVGVAWLAFGGGRSNRRHSPIAGTRRDAPIRWEDEGGPVGGPDPADDMSWAYEADSLRDRARDALARIEDAATAGLASVAQTAEDRAEVVSRYAKEAAVAIRRGLEDLPAATQTRIVALREQAYHAPRSALAAPQRLLEDSPLVAGAMALAMGAGVAAALPKTATEDRLFGAERDRLITHAQATLRAERERAADVVADLAGTLRNELHGVAERYPRAVGT